MSQLQANLFQHIKAVLPSNLSLADEVADVLDVSIDSAYRRIRGEKQLYFEEIQKLSSRFRISVDKVLNTTTDSILFYGSSTQHQNFDFSKYLDNIHNNIASITGVERKELFNFSKDIPIYYYCMFPELAAFKFFVWMKTLLQYPQYTNVKFSLEKIENSFIEKAKTIAAISCQIPTTEILNIENIQTTLRQIEYYKDTGLFASEKEIDLVYCNLIEMIDHLQNICTEGRKYMPHQKVLPGNAVVKMYVNDFVIGDNSNLAILNGKKICYINHNVIDFIATYDENFCNYTYNLIQNIIKKSTQISEVGERERVIFFNNNRQRIRMYQENKIKTLGTMSPYY